jgi:antitoxin (DNA-binding transcriptional repressor) of toxin-antitoxin stability system
MTMKKVNIFEAKARLSECIDAVQHGEQVVICRRNQPVAELRAITIARTTPRPLGGAKGLAIPEAFFEPLPDDVVDAFYGDVSRRAPSRVAEAPASPRKGRPGRSRAKQRRG